MAMPCKARGNVDFKDGVWRCVNNPYPTNDHWSTIATYLDSHRSAALMRRAPVEKASNRVC